MLRPSTAPRWKIATSSRFRASAASAARARNEGAKPSDSIAIPPDFTKMRLESMVCSLPFLECRAADGRGLRAGHLLRDIHARHERPGGDPCLRLVVVPGRRLAHVRR